MSWYEYCDDKPELPTKEARFFDYRSLLYPYEFIGLLLDLLEGLEEMAAADDDDEMAAADDDDEMADDFQTASEVVKRLFLTEELLNLPKLEKSLGRMSKASAAREQRHKQVAK